MKILLLNQTFHPDVASTAQHLSDLALGLAGRGHEVTVVTSRRAYDHPGKFFPKRETWRGIQIIRIGSTGFGKGSKWRRAIDFASFLLLCTVRIVSLPRYDVVLALTSPPLISFLGAWVAKLRGSRFFYWVMDFNPDEAIAAGWTGRVRRPRGCWMPCRGSVCGVQKKSSHWIGSCAIAFAQRASRLKKYPCSRRGRTMTKSVSTMPGETVFARRTGWTENSW